MQRFSRKTSASFRHERFLNISRLHRGTCHLEKPRTNKITELLAFTLCKLELRGKAIVLQSRSRRTQFNRGQLWEKQNESDVLRQNKNKPRSATTRVQGRTQRTKRKEKNVLPQNKNKPRRKCRIVVSKMQGGDSFRIMKNPTTKNDPGLFLEVALS